MTLPGETILTGAPIHCPDCGTHSYFEVLRSNAGFYVGTECQCGPRSRESEYMDESDAAHLALVLNAVSSCPMGLNSFCYLLLNGFKLRGFS